MSRIFLNGPRTLIGGSLRKGNPSRRRFLRGASVAGVCLLARPAIVRASARTLLTAPLTLYLSPTGNDANDGLTPGTPMLTLNAAWLKLATQYDMQGQDTVLQLANGTGAAPFVYQPFATNLGCLGQNGYGGVTIQGAVPNDAGTIIDASVADGIILGAGSSNGVQATVRNLTIRGAAGNRGGVTCFGAGNGVIVRDVTFAGDFTNPLLIAAHGAEIGAQGYELILGRNIGGYFESITSGRLTADGCTIAFGNALGTTFTLSGCHCWDAAMNLGGMTFVNPGLAIGQRFDVTFNGVILTGGGPTYLPGTVVGYVGSGGQYS